MKQKLLTKAEKEFAEQDAALKYSPDEERDDNGRWTGGGSAAGSGSIRTWPILGPGGSR